MENYYYFEWAKYPAARLGQWFSGFSLHHDQGGFVKTKAAGVRLQTFWFCRPAAWPRTCFANRFTAEVSAPGPRALLKNHWLEETLLAELLENAKNSGDVSDLLWVVVTWMASVQYRQQKTLGIPVRSEGSGRQAIYATLVRIKQFFTRLNNGTWWALR